jgi:dGTPase
MRKSAKVFARLKVFERDKEQATGFRRASFTAERVGALISSVQFKPHPTHPPLSSVVLTRDALIAVELLKHLNFELVIRSPQLAIVEHRGQKLVEQLFDALKTSSGSLLPKDWVQRYRQAQAVSHERSQRVLCDYLAGMTDRYAAELHGRLFAEGATVFKPI